MTGTRGAWRPVVGSTGPHTTTAKLSASRSDPRVRRYWRLTLTCGHVVTRSCRYEPDPAYPKPGRGNSYQRSVDDVAPAPHRVLCDRCTPADAPR